MHVILSTQSTLTDRYQTTVPESIRNALHLRKRDKIKYVIDDNGNVMLLRAEENDPALEPFLNFIIEDINNHPKQVKFISPTLYSRAKTLISDVDVDLDSSLSDEDE